MDAANSTSFRRTLKYAAIAYVAFAVVSYAVDPRLPGTARVSNGLTPEQKERAEKKAAREKLLPLALRYLPLDDARLLLADWSLDDPQNPDPLRLRAMLEEQQGDLKMALDCTQRALRLRPGNADLAIQRKRILDGMQRHSSRDTPSHKAAP